MQKSPMLILCATKKTHKAEYHITRLTLGGNKIDYPEDPSSPAVGLLDTRIHLNSVISDSKKGAR